MQWLTYNSTRASCLWDGLGISDPWPKFGMGRTLSSYNLLSQHKVLQNYIFSVESTIYIQNIGPGQRKSGSTMS